MGKSLRRTALGAALLLAMPAAALAANPQWQKADASLSSDGTTVSVAFKEVGLGNTGSTSVFLTANVNALWGCFTKSGNEPAATNKQSGAVSSTPQTFPVRNGQTTGTASLTISPGSFSCPPGQRLRLISASYTDITIHGDAGAQATSPSSLSYP